MLDYRLGFSPTLAFSTYSRLYYAMRKKQFLLCASLASLLVAFTPPSAMAQVEEVIIFGRGEEQIGIAIAASEGTIGGADLLVRPLLRVAELLEAIPGMIAGQHSGTGKANQYFLRGFNLDHGSDFTTYIDDVQMNFRSHGHGHGYLDLNGLIPEIIERQEYRKGPYRADGSDFALAGASYMVTLDGYDENWIAGEVGTYGWQRLASGGTFDAGTGELTMVGQWKTYNGAWQQAEELAHYSSFAKYVQPLSFGFFDFTMHGYYATWLPTEQIPERAIGSSLCADQFCALDPSATGETTRFIGSARVQGNTWRANIFAQYYDWMMFSNPTYFNADGTSAQIKQFDSRWSFGMKAEKTFMFDPDIELRVGTEDRYDAISSVGVHETSARAFVNSLGEFEVNEGSLSAFSEATWTPLNRLRLMGGLRGDYYDFGVKAIDAAAYKGNASDTMVSAKALVAYQVSNEIEVYANWGQGFHSNDARGVVHPTNSVPGLVRGIGKEIGARFQTNIFQFTATYWWLNVDSELKFIGDTNSIEPSEASKRHGLELVAFWQPYEWLSIDGNYTISNARFLNSPGAEYVPGGFENAGQIGFSIIQDEWEGSLRLRHLGPYPIVEDNSEREDGSTILNIRTAWKPRRWEIYAEVLNIFDTHDEDIAYFYESYLLAFDDAPVDGRVSRVVEPLTVRVGAKFKFN
jgi:outer membrane receptor protein involved in Fe transport